MTVHVGIGLFTGQVRPGSSRTFTQEYRETTDLVRLAETVGFDSAWVSEHHGAGDGYMPSLLPMLAAFAEATDRIRLGTGVMLTPFHDPLRLAEDAATVDLLSGGRLILGLGMGWREEEFRMFGQSVAERLARTTETVEILRRAWTGERFSFDGRAYSYDRVQVTPAPEREGAGSAGGAGGATIPILLAGHAEPAILRAGRLGDGWIRSRSPDVDAIRHDLSVLETGARDAGRDPSKLAFVQIRSAFVWDDGDPWALVRDGLAHASGVYAGWDDGGDTPGRGFVLPDFDEQRARSSALVGTPQEVAHRMRAFAAAIGERRDLTLVVRLHYPGMDYETSSHAVELFGEHVIPALKGA